MKRFGHGREKRWTSRTVWPEFESGVTVQDNHYYRTSDKITVHRMFSKTRTSLFIFLTVIYRRGISEASRLNKTKLNRY